MRRGLLAALLAVSATRLVAQEPVAPDPGSVLGPPRGQALSGAELDARTEAVASLLRCPVCQGLSVADSPASMALSMKAQVRELLAKGYEREQVLAYFEHSYGEFVRLEPPLRGVNWLVWAAPVALLVIGGFFVLFMMKRLQRAPKNVEVANVGSAAPGRDTLPDDEHLAHYVLRTRELVYGWPGGLSPASRGEGGEESR